MKYIPGTTLFILIICAFALLFHFLPFGHQSFDTQKERYQSVYEYGVNVGYEMALRDSIEFRNSGTWPNAKERSEQANKDPLAPINWK